MKKFKTEGEEKPKRKLAERDVVCSITFEYVAKKNTILVETVVPPYYYTIVQARFKHKLPSRFRLPNSEK